MTVPSYTDEEIRAAMAADDAAAAAFEADNIAMRSGGRKISYDGLALTNDGEPERQGRRPSSATATSAEIQDALDRTAGNIGECLGLTVPEVWNQAYQDIWPARDEESVAGWFVEMAGKVAEGGPSKPYGNVTYADAGLQADGKKRYPVDTEAHVRAAWSYINQGKNASAYSSSQLASIKAKIKAAAKKLGVSIGGSDSDSDDKVAAAKHARSASAGTLGLTGTLDSRDTLSLADRQREDGNDEAARIVGRHAKKTGLFSDKAKADAKKRGFDPDRPDEVTTATREHAPDEEDVSVDHQALIDGYLAKALERPHGANSIGQKLTPRERRQAETRALAGGRP